MHAKKAFGKERGEIWNFFLVTLYVLVGRVLLREGRELFYDQIDPSSFLCSTHSNRRASWLSPGAAVAP